MNVRWLDPFGGIKEQLVRANIGYGRHAIHLSINMSSFPGAFSRRRYACRARNPLEICRESV
jgi:hypothetical protein